MNQSTDNGKALSLEDCLRHADETKELLIQKDALEEIPALLSKYFEFEAVCLIADDNTLKAAGSKLKKILDGGKIKCSGSYIFPGEPRLHAEYNHVVALKDWISSMPDYPRLVPIAIGAGTVNDLLKRTSFELKIPYLCVPTAASVDGYTPNGAALLVDGLKQTLPCTAPLVVAADTDVIAQAPAYLSSSGFGDLASKIITGTDWIIAEKAGSLGASEAPAIDPIPWAMVQNGLMDALNRSVNAAKGDKDAINALFQALAITGFAMQYMKSSRPVSGSEHLWSHVWEMEDLSVNGVSVTHGHKVTIGTLAATAFTEIFFADPKGPPQGGIPKSRRQNIQGLFRKAGPSDKRPSRDERRAEVSEAFKDSKAHDKVVATALEKMMEEQTVQKINQAFRDSWKEIRGRVLEKLVPYGELKALLEKAGCPLRPEEIGLSRTEAIATARRAQMIRNKYGILDLAWDMGNFEKILDLMESSDLYLK